MIPNYAAGALIGRGGSNISELQKQYGAKLRLSPSGEFYPDTDERVVIITGEINQIIDLHNYIMDKVHTDATEGPGAKFHDSERGQQVKIIVPNATAGLVIGRSGASIKSLQEDTGAKIMISGRDESKVEKERIITISGNDGQRLEASRAVISKIAADPENMLNKNLTYGGGSRGSEGGGSRGRKIDSRGYSNGADISSRSSMFGSSDVGLPGNLSALSSILGSMQQNPYKQNPLAGLSQQNALQAALGLTSSLGGMSGMSSFGSNPLSAMGAQMSNLASNIKTTVTIQMEIPDVLVGAILGKGGKTVNEFIQFSGAKIQFSAKNDFAPGTTDRVLTIQGDLNQTQIAYFLINQKISQAENDLANQLKR